MYLVWGECDDARAHDNGCNQAGRVPDPIRSWYGGLNRSVEARINSLVDLSIFCVLKFPSKIPKLGCPTPSTIPNRVRQHATTMS